MLKLDFVSGREEAEDASRKSVARLAIIHDVGTHRLIGCLQLQVIFRERATIYRALLREMTYEDKAPYDPTPPCTHRLIRSPGLVD